MKDLIKCPICGKNGIPDFHKEDVVCPCCGSDLSVYHKLSDLSETSTGKPARKYLIPILVVLIFASISCCVLLLHIQRNETFGYEQIARLQEQNSILSDSIINLNEKIAKYHSRQQANTGSSEETRIYIVNEGDSFWKISRRLYGTGGRYTEIAKLNNLDIETTLYPGDRLKVSEK